MLSIQELQSSTLKELFQELEKARKESLKTRINVKTKSEKDTSKVKKNKRYVALVLTALKDAKMEEAKKGKSDKPKEEELSPSTAEEKVEKKAKKSAKSKK